jgi:hypothetical protein
MKNFGLYHEKIGTWDDEKKMYFQVDEYDDMIFYSKRPKARFRNTKNRSAYHNELHREERCMQSAENSLIRKNWTILKKMYPSSLGYVPIPMSQLTELGFSLHAQSKIEIERSTGLYLYSFYDYSMKPIENNQQVIIYQNKKKDGNHTT